MSGEIYVQDFAALETLFKRFYKPLRAYAFRFVNDKDLSEDIVQDVFYELWKRRESIRFEDESVKSYLFKAVYTHALNALDKKQQDVYPLKPERETDILDQYVSSYMQNSEQSLLLKELEEESEVFKLPDGKYPFISVGCHLSFSLDSQRVERKFHAGE